jgi:hypothetical protein
MMWNGSFPMERGTLYTFGGFNSRDGESGCQTLFEGGVVLLLLLLLWPSLSSLLLLLAAEGIVVVPQSDMVKSVFILVALVVSSLSMSWSWSSFLLW